MIDSTVVSLIGTLGFPIVACIIMALFIFRIYKNTTAENEKRLAEIQANCAAREEKLYEQIEKNQEVNAQAIATITLYAERLDHIQRDVNAIKEVVITDRAS